MSQKTYSTVYESARQQERESVEKFIEDIKHGLAGTPFFLNLFAPRGFGKTAFVRQIWDQYERVMPASLVRVSDFLEEDSGPLSLNAMLIQLIGDLGERLPRRVAPLPSDYDALTNEKQLAELLLALISGAREYEKVTLLLIDDYDLMPEKQRRWFQERVFSPAARTRKSAVILTSETELRFTESFELRMRLECRALTSLDSKAISRALPEYEEIAEDIHRITGGLPLLTEKFVEELETFHVATPADFHARAQELTSKYYRAYVEDEVLAALASDVQETMLVLALLRRFDVKVLKQILPAVLPAAYQGLGTADYLDLIDRLRPWVDWRRQGGYAITPALRMMLQGYVLAIRPKLFTKVNRAAVIVYRRLLKRDGYRKYYLLELLHHRLLVDGFEESSRARESRLGEELRNYLGSENAASIQAADLDSLRNSLRHDEDLKSHVSEDVLEMIQDMIDRKANGIPVILDAEDRWIHLAEDDEQRPEVS